jgi:5-methylcytosine-specific restriction endonuclease McrA
MDYFDYGEQDFVPCEVEGRRCVDVHHLIFKSQGGKDIIENLIGLCRDCHNEAHKNTLFNESLKTIHMLNL